MSLIFFYNLKLAYLKEVERNKEKESERKTGKFGFLTHYGATRRQEFRAL